LAQQSLQPKLSHRCYASVSYALQNNTSLQMHTELSQKVHQNVISRQKNHKLSGKQAQKLPVGNTTGPHGGLLGRGNLSYTHLPRYCNWVPRIFSVSALRLLVGSSDLYKPIPNITYNVFGGTLNLAQSNPNISTSSHAGMREW